SGPGNAPSGTAPTFPTTSVTFVNGVSTTTLNATLVKAESATLTATAAGPIIGSASITVNAGTASRLAWKNVVFSPAGTPSTPCLFTCTNTIGNNGTFTANVSVTDGLGNTVSNVGAGHTVTVNGAAAGAFTAPTAGSSV